MNEIKINNKVYILKSSIKTEIDLKNQIAKLENKLKTKADKYAELNIKYRTLYMKYKHQSDRLSSNRQKYVEIIHKLQCEIINQAKIEDLIKEVDRMSEIEKNI